MLDKEERSCGIPTVQNISMTATKEYSVRASTALKVLCLQSHVDALKILVVPVGLAGSEVL